MYICQSKQKGIDEIGARALWIILLLFARAFIFYASFLQSLRRVGWILCCSQMSRWKNICRIKEQGLDYYYYIYIYFFWILDFF